MGLDVRAAGAAAVTSPLALALVNSCAFVDFTRQVREAEAAGADSAQVTLEGLGLGTVSGVSG